MGNTSQQDKTCQFFAMEVSSEVSEVANNVNEKNNEREMRGAEWREMDRPAVY